MEVAAGDKIAAGEGDAAVEKVIQRSVWGPSFV